MALRPLAPFMVELFALRFSSADTRRSSHSGTPSRTLRSLKVVAPHAGHRSAPPHSARALPRGGFDPDAAEGVLTVAPTSHETAPCPEDPRSVCVAPLHGRPARGIG